MNRKLDFVKIPSRIRTVEYPEIIQVRQEDAKRECDQQGLIPFWWKIKELARVKN